MVTRTMKRHAVEFRSTRSPRDALLGLPIRDGEMPPLAPKQDPDALAGRGRDCG